MPRKTLLDEERFKKIVNLVKAGNFANVAAAAAGISERTYYKWLERGREEADLEVPEGEEESIFVRFVQAIKEAESLAEARTVMKIQTATEDHWQAAGWYLERKFPDRWGRRDRSHIELSDSREVVERVPPSLSEVMDILSELGQLPELSLIHI